MLENSLTLVLLKTQIKNIRHTYGKDKQKTEKVSTFEEFFHK